MTATTKDGTPGLPEPAPLPRWLWLLPFAVYGGSALALIAASFSARGVADSVGYPAWAPTAGGILFAVPNLLFAILLATLTWRHTSAPYRVAPRRLAIGLLGIAAATALTVAYAFSIHNISSYQGAFNTVTNKYDPAWSLKYFIAASFLLGAVWPCGVLALFGKFGYVDGLRRIEKRPAGPDAIGQMLAERGPRS